MSRYKIIVNPTSGRGQGGQAVAVLKQLLDHHQLDYDLTLTEAPWHAVELASAAVRTGFDVVVAVGGDGTANEVLNGIIQAGPSQTAMGLIGIGRGNDFAYGLHIPTELAAAVEVLAVNHQETIDVGRVSGGDFPDGRYFGNGVGIGFDAVVGFEALKLKLLKGFLSYIVAAVRTIFVYAHPPLIKLTYNGTNISEDFLMISVMNGRRMGGGFMMAPEGETADGQFDLCIASNVGKSRVLPLIMQFIKGTQKDHPAIRMVRCQQLKATAVNGGIPAHADGETLCESGNELVFEILPEKINVVCPVTEVAA